MDIAHDIPEDPSWRGKSFDIANEEKMLSTDFDPVLQNWSNGGATGVRLSRVLFVQSTVVYKCPALLL